MIMPKFARCGLLVALATVALLAGCKRGQQSTSRPAEQSAKPPVGSTLAIAGRMLSGADQTTIRSYLQTVQEVKPKKFSVQWSPDTVPVSREEAMRSLQRINEDGSLFTFASSEPIVAQLAPGRILWIWNIAIRRVDSVDTFGDVTVVHTKPVALNEALPQADIEFETQANLGTAYGGLRQHPPKRPAPQKTSSVIQRPPYRVVALNMHGPDEPDAKQQQPDQENSPPPPENDEDDYGVVAATEDGYNGKIAGFEYSLQYKVLPSHVTFEMEARKEEEGGGAGESNETHRDQHDEYMELVAERRETLHQASMSYARVLQLNQAIDAANRELANKEGKTLAGSPPSLGPHAPSPNASPDTARLYNSIKQYNEEKEQAYKDYEKREKQAEEEEIKMKARAAAGALAKQVFYIISDNLDVRFRGKMDLDRAAFSGNIQTAGGAVKQFAAHFSDMKGKVEMEFVGRLGQPGNGAVSVPIVNVPAVMNVPVPVAGIPFVLQFGGNFMVKLFLAGNHATQHFSTHFEFGGGAGLDSTTKGTDSEGNLSTSDPQIEDKTALSPGTSGLVLAIQLPRVGLGLGFLGPSAMAYMDLVHVLTMTNSAAVATLNPPCQRFTLDTIGSVGVDVNVMPIPIPLVHYVASKALSQRKEVWRRSPPWKYINPNIAMCRLSGD
jgi:hypothetical protein